MNGPVRSDVTGCPCGESHPMRLSILAMYDQITAGKDPDMKVEVTGVGSWMVPRIYIACHGIKGGELPALAEQYGWPPA